MYFRKNYWNLICLICLLISACVFTEKSAEVKCDPCEEGSEMKKKADSQESQKLKIIGFTAEDLERAGIDSLQDLDSNSDEPEIDE